MYQHAFRCDQGDKALNNITSKGMPGFYRQEDEVLMHNKTVEIWMLWRKQSHFTVTEMSVPKNGQIKFALLTWRKVKSGFGRKRW